jgi:transposase InsO family protein
MQAAPRLSKQSLVVMDQFTRRIVGFGVQAVAVDGPALCRMFHQAISEQGLPTRLSTDHDRMALR